MGRVQSGRSDPHRDFGAASATPAIVFPLLLHGLQNHIGKLHTEREDVWIEGEIDGIIDHLPRALPRTPKLEAQGCFLIGLCHQRRAPFIAARAPWRTGGQSGR